MKKEVSHIKVSEDDDGQRLDRWLKKQVPNLPYGLAQKLIRKGQLRVDGKRAKADTKLSAGQEVRIPPIESKPERSPQKLSAGDAAFIRSLVIYEDAEIIALNKPYDLAVQGGTKTRRHIDGMLDALKNKEGVRPRLVHRLDKDTSGVLLLARSAKSAKALGAMFKKQSIRKIYWALTIGVPEMHEGQIDASILKSGGFQKEKMRVDPEEGKRAFTDYSVIEHAGKQAAFIAFWPRTGRMHQIRVHAEIMGCPIIGDRKYRGEVEPLEGIKLAPRLHLHARSVIFAHPFMNKTVEISAPLPPDLLQSWKSLGFNAKYKGDPFADIKN